MTLRRRLVAWAERHATRHVNAAGEVGPDFVVGDHQLDRWWLVPRNRWLNVYLHRFNRSDEDRALHDHMYVNLSWVLGPGGYHEVVPVARRPWYPTTGLVRTVSLWRQPGALVARRPTRAHRIVLATAAPVWSLFVTGPRIREWGFWCPQGFRHWREFTDARDAGQVGRGCG